MALQHALESYRKNENDYIEGINSPHGRVTILFNTILGSVDCMMEKHPKTDFINMGKALNESMDRVISGEILSDTSRRAGLHYLQMDLGDGENRVV